MEVIYNTSSAIAQYWSLAEADLLAAECCRHQKVSDEGAKYCSQRKSRYVLFKNKKFQQNMKIVWDEELAPQRCQLLKEVQFDFIRWLQPKG